MVGFDSSFVELDSLKDSGAQDGVWHRYTLVFLMSGVSILFLAAGLYIYVSNQYESRIVISSPQTIVDSAEESTGIYVDISGEVINPGVYVLDAGSRVQDVIEIAGGFTELADISWVDLHINRAEVVSDGGKIYIPSVEYVDVSNSVRTAYVSINNATRDELMALPGVGEATANKIIESRPYSSVSDLFDSRILRKNLESELLDRLVL